MLSEASRSKLAFPLIHLILRRPPTSHAVSWSVKKPGTDRPEILCLIAKIANNDVAEQVTEVRFLVEWRCLTW